MSNPTGINRVTTFFQDDQISVGWTETLYLASSDLSVAFAEAAVLAGLRANFLPSQFHIPWLRVDTLFAGRQFIAMPPNLGSTLIGQYVVGDVLYPTTRILCDITGTGVSNTNHVFLGGLSGVDVTGQQFRPTMAFVGAFNAWASRLKATGNQWSTYNRKNGGLAARHAITASAPLPPRGNVITTDDTSSLFVGAIVRIGAPVTSIQGLQGYKVVTRVVDGTHFWTGGAVAVGVVPATGSSFWQLQTVNVHPILSVFGTRLTERRVGRPFGQPVGRRPNRIPLRA